MKSMKSMKSWDEFEIGKKYRLINNSLEARCLMCVGFSSSGLPIMETNSDWYYTANRFNGGTTPGGWEEYRKPREFWIGDQSGPCACHIYYNPADALPGESLIHVKEILKLKRPSG